MAERLEKAKQEKAAAAAAAAAREGLVTGRSSPSLLGCFSASVARVQAYRLSRLLVEPPRPLVVGVGSVGAGAVLAPAYLSWRCTDHIGPAHRHPFPVSSWAPSQGWVACCAGLSSRAACDAAAAGGPGILSAAGDGMVSAPLLLCFLMGLTVLLPSAATPAAATPPAANGQQSNAALASMATGTDPRVMERLFEGGGAVLGVLSSARMLIDDACGAAPTPTPAPRSPAGLPVVAALSCWVVARQWRCLASCWGCGSAPPGS